MFGRIDDASPRLREQLLEAMTRRYYRIGRLEGVEHREAGGVRFATTSFEHGGRRYRVAAAFAATEELEPTLRALGDMAGTLSEDERLLADVYAWRTDRPRIPTRCRGGSSSCWRGPSPPAVIERVTFVSPAPTADGRAAAARASR